MLINNNFALDVTKSNYESSIVFWKMPIVGKCMQMCPFVEIELREQEKLLHPLEMVRSTVGKKFPKADIHRIVKCFTRSAAGVDLTSPSLLRPTSILIKTVNYLLTLVVNDSSFSEICKYNFIVDRLRAVQQDMIIQMLPPEDCIQILEPIVKFHCLYGYKLCFEDISEYDPFLNKQNLLEYLKRLLVCYDELENYNLNESLMLLSISSDTSKYSLEKRMLTEAIYIASNLGDVHPLERYLALPKCYKKGYLKICFEMSLSYLTKNWVRVCRLMRSLPTVVLCCAVLYLPDIRRLAFQIMSCAYNSKVLKYPIDNLIDILLHNKEDVMKECQYYQLKIIDDEFICFNKEAFQNNKAFPLKKIGFIDDQINNDMLIS